MQLKFLGNGSGFASTHTGAYFIQNNNIIFIDCSMLNVQKMLSLKPFSYNNIYVLITHMHDDHVSGINSFLQHMYYLYSKTVKVIIPEVLKSDLLDEFRIKGIPQELFEIILTKDLNISWFIKDISTSHSPELANKCFGYQLNINNKNIVYTGDTCTIDNYLLFVEPNSEFYVDVSASYGKVHLKYDDVEDILNELSDYLDVYLMHLDDENLIRKKIKGTKIKIAEIES